jgi:hypothetical protein
MLIRNLHLSNLCFRPSELDFQMALPFALSRIMMDPKVLYVCPEVDVRLHLVNQFPF